MIDREYVDHERTIEFDVPREVKLDGTSIWSNTAGKISAVRSIRIIYTEGGQLNDGTPLTWVLIWVKHSLKWPIYTDQGFERGISDLISEAVGQTVKVGFTEQGMQEDYMASMETLHKDSDEILAGWVM